MLIIINAKPTSWNTDVLITRERIHGSCDPQLQAGQEYVVYYATIPDARRGESLDAYDDLRDGGVELKPGMEVYSARPTIFRVVPVK